MQALRALGGAKRAEQEKRYQKSRWEHWGVPLPSMDAAIKETLGDLSQEQALDLCRRLWREPVWDLKIVAGRILARKGIAPDAKVWVFVTERVADLDGWGAVEQSGECRVALPHRRLRPPRRRRNLDRKPAFVDAARSAGLHPALGEEKRDPERMLGWAARLAEDREWFIQKAIGWWLREFSSKRDPKRVRRFLTDHGRKLRGVAKREATKYLKA